MRASDEAANAEQDQLRRVLPFDTPPMVSRAQHDLAGVLMMCQLWGVSCAQEAAFKNLPSVSWPEQMTAGRPLDWFVKDYELTHNPQGNLSTYK